MPYRLDPFAFCAPKKTSANIKEQQKLMAEARVKRVTTQSTLQSDPSGLLTLIVRRKRPKTDRVADIVASSKAPSSSVPPLVKKQKGLTDMGSIINHVVYDVMQELE